MLNTVGVVENDFWVPNRLKIYQMCAIDLFISNKEYFLEEFLVAFDKITEITIYRKFLSKFVIDDVICGLGVRRIHKYRETILYLPKYRLTYNLEDRLQLLFSIKDLWSENELGIYLSDVTELSMPQFLLKNCKKVIEGTSVMYTSKLN